MLGSAHTALPSLWDSFFPTSDVLGELTLVQQSVQVTGCAAVKRPLSTHMFRVGDRA